MFLWPLLIHGYRRGWETQVTWVIARIWELFFSFHEILFLSESDLDRTVELTPTGSEIPGHQGTERMAGVWMSAQQAEMDSVP